MWRTERTRYVACAVWCGVVVACLGLSLAGCGQQQQSQSNRAEQAGGQKRQTAAAEQRKTGESGEIRMFVDPGQPNDALVYYKATFDELGLNPDNLSEEALVKAKDLAQMLVFLGYDGLTPRELEDAESAALMGRFPGDLLSSAFFAPKITDVSQSPTDAGAQLINVGWRKLIRLKARPDSPAARKGVASGFLLFNKFQGTDYSLSPFRPLDGDKANESKATQLILLRADQSSLKRPVYFFVYGPFSDGSKLITFLTATFDARAPNIVADNKYYVPHACAECHGGKITNVNDDTRYAQLKLNYLDTDHWFDRLDDDFAVIKTMKEFGVLFDGGKVAADGGTEETTDRFEQAFNVIRLLNNEIKEQNAKVEPAGQNPASFQLRAVTRWLELHGTSSKHQDVFARALPHPTGTPWRASESPDRELLPLLNQYCYRCHSSLSYSVFDRPAVVGRRGSIIQRLHLTPVADNRRMPQDRNLDLVQKWRDDKRRMHELVCRLNPTAPCPSPTPPTPTPTPTPAPSP